MASLTFTSINAEPKIARLVRAAEIAIGLLECHARPDQVAIALRNALLEFHKQDKNGGDNNGNRSSY